MLIDRGTTSGSNSAYTSNHLNNMPLPSHFQIWLPIRNYGRADANADSISCRFKDDMYTSLCRSLVMIIQLDSGQSPIFLSGSPLFWFLDGVTAHNNTIITINHKYLTASTSLSLVVDC